MGGKVRILLFAESAEGADRAVRAAFAAVADVDRAMSDYKPESELSRLSAAAGHGDQTVSDPLFEVLAAGQRMAALSDGAFDVTVGPFVQLWRKARRERRLPDLQAIEEARPLVGYRLLELDGRRKTARLERPGMKLDLGGIAKGYACDRAVKALEASGIRRALVEAGGGSSFALGDPPPGRDGWRIQILGHPELMLSLSRCGVTTSGDIEQYLEIDGRRYSHVVDPRTGFGLETICLTTIAAPDAMTADALGVAVSVLGPERGMALAGSLPGVQAWMEWRPPEGQGTRTARTPAS
jgi:thiamine biosynthesis lipoprotein